MLLDYSTALTIIKKYTKTWGIFVFGFCFAGFLLDIDPIVITTLVALMSGGTLIKILLEAVYPCLFPKEVLEEAEETEEETEESEK